MEDGLEEGPGVILDEVCGDEGDGLVSEGSPGLGGGEEGEEGERYADDRGEVHSEMRRNGKMRKR